MRAATVPTPIGPFSVIVDNDVGAPVVRVASFTDDFSALRARLPIPLRSGSIDVTREIEPYTSAIRAYLDGDLDALNALPVALPGGGFRAAVWQAMRKVAPGTTATYRELAEWAGNPRAVRAAGAACATNYVPLIVPCHRIIRSDGGLGGYYFGLQAKRWLLTHERALEV